MLTTRIVPCLDVKDGRIVKGVRFQGLRDAGDPAERAQLYEQQGADELVMLDVSATPQGRGNALETVRAVRRVLGIPLTVGGGVRAVADAEALLEAGADKVGVNTAAVRRPELLRELAERFGSQCVVLAVDAARTESGTPTGETESGTPTRETESGSPTWEVVVGSGRERTGMDAVAWAARGVALGAGEILLTSWDRDGTGAGYDTELLKAVSAAANVPVVASGGAKSAADCVEAWRAGASALLAASIFHDGETTVSDLKRSLAAEGMEVRT